MTQETDKPKTLSLKKPLSLAKETEIATLFKTPEQGLKRSKSEKSKFFKPELKVSKEEHQKQLSTKLGSQQNEGESQHNIKNQTSDGLSVEKDRETIEDKRHKQTSAKLRAQEEKERRSEVDKQREQRTQQALTWLKESCPACFKIDLPQPLKIGIYDDIVQILKQKTTENLPTQASLRKAIKSYVQHRAYYEMILTSSHRYDLEGNIAQEITNQEKEYPRACLDRLDKKHQKQQKS